jgi:hypothetical protein
LQQQQQQQLSSTWFLSTSTSNDISLEDNIILTDDASIDDNIESIINNDVNSKKETKDDSNVSY